MKLSNKLLLLLIHQGESLFAMAKQCQNLKYLIDYVDDTWIHNHLLTAISALDKPNITCLKTKITKQAHNFYKMLIMPTSKYQNER